jgi:uncharacterized membrane protein
MMMGCYMMLGSLASASAHNELEAFSLLLLCNHERAGAECVWFGLWGVSVATRCMMIIHGRLGGVSVTSCQST